MSLQANLAGEIRMMARDSRALTLNSNHRKSNQSIEPGQVSLFDLTFQTTLKPILTQEEELILKL